MAEADPLHSLRPGPLARTKSHLFTAEEIKSFAGQYDPQPMHTDEEAAIGGPFGQLAASGWHGLAVTMRLFVESLPFGKGHYVGAGIDNIRFHRPLLPGMEIHVEAEILELRPSSKGNRLHGSLTALTKDSHTGETVISQDWRVLIYPDG